MTHCMASCRAGSAYCGSSEFPTPVSKRRCARPCAWLTNHRQKSRPKLWTPSTKPVMKPESQDALLTAIAKARGWIDDIRLEDSNLEMQPSTNRLKYEI